MRRLPELLARFVERRPWWLIVVTVVLTAATVPGITMLKTETGIGALVSSGSEIFKDNSQHQEQFGGETTTVLLTGQLEDIFSAGNLAILNEFEQELSQDQRFHNIFSPVTIFKLAAAAQQMPVTPLDNPMFIQSVLYDSSGSISYAMAPLIPDEQHAIAIVTPAGNMSDEEALQAAEKIEQFFLTHPLDNVSTTVIADAKITNAISNSIGNNMALLLGLSVVAMVLILVLLFRVRWRLLSLLMVGIGAAWTFGIMGYASVPLSMATMAILPILIGLGIDYSIQFHSRYQEEVNRRTSVAEAIITSMKLMFPVVGIALIATVIGFITLYISDVPMVRDFGIILAVGVVLCYLVAIFMLHSTLYIADRKTPVAKLGQTAAASHRIERTLSWIATTAVKNPLPILLIAAIWGIVGGVVDHRIPTNTDYENLIPQDITELRQVQELRQILGYSGELILMVEAEDVTDADFLTWLKRYQDDQVMQYPEIVSVNSPASLIGEASGGIIPDQQQIEKILGKTPPLYVQQVISEDRTIASVSFAKKHTSLQHINDLLEKLERDALPPDGVHIAPVGMAALSASMVDAVVETRFIMNVFCMGAIFLALLLVYRHLSRAIFTILPVGMVLGWSSLDMYITGIPLNPLTAILGVIIIGINTEFMVLLTSRYEEEKKNGESPHRAMVIATSKTGRAIVTTGLTTLAGFGTLVASNFVMIRDFGLVTIMGVSLCMLSTIVIMPPLIVWFDERRFKKHLSKNGTGMAGDIIPDDATHSNQY